MYLCVFHHSRERKAIDVRRKIECQCQENCFLLVALRHINDQLHLEPVQACRLLEISESFCLKFFRPNLSYLTPGKRYNNFSNKNLKMIIIRNPMMNFIKIFFFFFLSFLFFCFDFLLMNSLDPELKSFKIISCHILKKFTHYSLLL